MAESIKDKHLTAPEVAKLKSTVNAIVVSLQQMEDARISYSDLAGATAAELDLKKAEIIDAARTLHKQNIAAKRAKQDAVEDILTTLGYDLDDEPDV